MIDTASQAATQTLFKDDKEAGIILTLIFNGIESVLRACQSV